VGSNPATSTYYVLHFKEEICFQVSFLFTVQASGSYA